MIKKKQEAEGRFSQTAKKINCVADAILRFKIYEHEEKER